MTKAKPEPSWLRPPGPVANGLKIGLLGGSFNPAHEGHVYASEVALKRLGLDYVWWLVAPQNPLKPTAGMMPLCERLTFAADRFEQDPRIVVVDIETVFGTRYTIDTLAALKRRFPGVHFVWLMGSDNLQSFHRWWRWSDIAKMVPIAVVVRPGSSLASLRSRLMERFPKARVRATRRLPLERPPAITILDGRRNPMSATAIRRKQLQGEVLARCVPT